MIPFVDLKANYASVKADVDRAISEVLSNTAFIAGKYAARFEDSFAGYLGARHCVGVANGTDALEIALRAIGIQPGDEVIVPANTFIATAEAVSNVGAIPVFVDSHPELFTIDVPKIQAKISAKTRAIAVVHLYGLPAEMDEVMQVARQNQLLVLEDCAQAHGAEYKGRKVGTFGSVATFSFYPSKNLGAFGDAGAIVTNDKDIAARARLIANHGQAAKNRHSIVGRNSRMDGIQAAVLSVKLSHLDSWIKARRANAAVYNGLLSDVCLSVPKEPSYSTHTYHLYVVRVPEREKLQEKLHQAGIETGLHYPIALPFMEAYGDLGLSADEFPVASMQMNEILSLPMYPELDRSMIETVCSELRAALASEPIL